MKKLLLTSLVVAFGLLACGETKVSGGVSEETNTIAGLLENEFGPVSGVDVLARSLSKDFLVSTSTDSLGQFKMDLPYGLYALTASDSTGSYYELVRVSGEDLEISGALLEGFDASVVVLLSDSSFAEGVKVSLPGTDLKTVVSESGLLEFENLPQGNYVIELESPEVSLYENVYYRVNGTSFIGPYPETIPLDSICLLEVSREVNTSDSLWVLPWNTDISLWAYWNFDRLDSSARVSALSIPKEEFPFYLYGDVKMVSSLNGKALSFRDSSSFAVLEGDSGIFNGATEFTVETWVNFKDVPQEGAFQKNIVGKVGFGGESDSSVFSLALIQGLCETTSPSLAFFVADGSGMPLDCENAVVDSSEVIVGEWIQVIASFDNGVLRLFRNGEEKASKSSLISKIQSSNESIYLGKETIIFDIDALRISGKGIKEADAFLRFYKYGGR